MTAKNIGIDPRDKDRLDAICEKRGMTIRELVARLVRWMDTLDPGEQAIVLDQVSRGDQAAIAALVLARAQAEDLEAIVRQLALVRAAHAAGQPGTKSPTPKTEKRRA